MQITTKNKPLMASMFLGSGDAERCFDILGWEGPTFPFILDKEIMGMGNGLKPIFLNKVMSKELVRLGDFNIYVHNSIDPEVKTLIEQHLLKNLFPAFLKK